jgi:hypothetical protein
MKQVFLTSVFALLAGTFTSPAAFAFDRNDIPDCAIVLGKNSLNQHGQFALREELTKKGYRLTKGWANEGEVLGMVQTSRDSRYDPVAGAFDLAYTVLTLGVDGGLGTGGYKNAVRVEFSLQKVLEDNDKLLMTAVQAKGNNDKDAIRSALRKLPSCK